MSHTPQFTNRERRADLIAADRVRRDLLRQFGTIGGKWRVSITAEQLIAEVFHASAAEIPDRQTREEYRSCQQHWCAFLEQYGLSVFGAEPVHVKLFLGHLTDEMRGSATQAADARAELPVVCRARLPDGAGRRRLLAELREEAPGGAAGALPSLPG
jgi:hypothetical protein